LRKLNRYYYSTGRIGGETPPRSAGRVRRRISSGKLIVSRDGAARKSVGEKKRMKPEETN